MLEGKMTGILKTVAAMIVAANPSERETEAGNAGVYLPLRVDVGDGVVLTGNLTLTVNGSRWIGLSPAEVAKAKKAEKALKAAEDAGIPLPPEVAEGIAALKAKAKAAREQAASKKA